MRTRRRPLRTRTYDANCAIGTPDSGKSYSLRTRGIGSEPRKAMTTLGDLMTRDVVTVAGTVSAEYARELMVRHRISRVVIVTDTGSPI